MSDEAQVNSKAPPSLIFNVTNILKLHLLVCALIALYAPLSVLNDFPILSSMTGLLKALFYPIEGYVGKSKFPQVTELYFSLMWLFSPIYFVAALQYFRSHPSIQTLNCKGVVDWLIVLASVCLFLTISFFDFFINPGYDFSLLLPINSSRLALAVGGVLLSGAAGAALLAAALAYGIKLMDIITNVWRRNK